MEWFTLWREILGISVNSGAIQLGAVQFTVMARLYIKSKAKEYQRVIPLELLHYITHLMLF